MPSSSSSSPKPLFSIFQHAWYLDALLFWSIFVVSTIFVVWLLATTTKETLREKTLTRILSLTNTTAETLSSQSHFIQNDNPHSEKVRSSISRQLQTLVENNREVLAAGIVYFEENQIKILSQYKNPNQSSAFSDLLSPNDPHFPYQQLIHEAKNLPIAIKSPWEFLGSQELPIFTEITESPEYTLHSLAGWQLPNSQSNCVLIITFDAPFLQKALLQVDANTATVIAVSILIGTILSLLVRARSMQRLQAIEEKLAAVNLLRQRDSILAAIASAIDELLAKEDLRQSLTALLRKIKEELNVSACYCTLRSPDEPLSHPGAYAAPLGQLTSTNAAITLTFLKENHLDHWHQSLKQGKTLALSNIEAPEKRKLTPLSQNIKSLILIPINYEDNMLGLLVVEDHNEYRIWQPGLIDCLKLTADVFSAAFVRQEHEKRLRDGSKMQALGRMAGGVAHEFNNLLHMISGNLRILMKSTHEEEKNHLLASRMLEATERGSNIVDQLLRTTRQSKPNLNVICLNTLIQSMSSLFHSVLKKGVTLKLSLDPKLPNSSLDETLIQQVILNIILNANDAIKDKGFINVSTGVTNHFFKQEIKKFVFCQIEDTGEGIPEENLEHLFDPFFTTKAPGKGTGLGLSTSRGILEQHNGLIEAQNWKGGGASFTFYLPISTQPSSTSTTQLLPSEDTSLKGTILFADDEELCRDVMIAHLDEMGYSYWAAKTGTELLDLARQHQKQINWVITDWTMPGPDGPQLLQSLRKILPETPIIVTSGFVLNRDEIPEIDALIQKPFDPNQVFEKMKSLAPKNKSI